jgi:hypothetical protein
VVQRPYVNWPHFSQLANGRRLIATLLSGLGLCIEKGIGQQLQAAAWPIKRRPLSIAASSRGTGLVLYFKPAA